MRIRIDIESSFVFMFIALGPIGQQNVHRAGAPHLNL
jgi:hypothetical protein